MPALVLTFKIQASKVTEHAGHGDRAASPRTTEIKVEFIVLDIWIPANSVL